MIELKEICPKCQGTGMHQGLSCLKCGGFGYGCRFDGASFQLSDGVECSDKDSGVEGAWVCLRRLGHVGTGYHLKNRRR